MLYSNTKKKSRFATLAENSAFICTMISDTHFTCNLGLTLNKLQNIRKRKQISFPEQFIICIQDWGLKIWPIDFLWPQSPPMVVIMISKIYLKTMLYEAPIAKILVLLAHMVQWMIANQNDGCLIYNKWTLIGQQKLSWHQQRRLSNQDSSLIEIFGGFLFPGFHTLRVQNCFLWSYY